MNTPIITSILDQDQYKLNMCACILRANMAGISYENLPVEYEFINRNKTEFPSGFAELLQKQVNMMSELSLRNYEADFLREKCYYLKHSFIEWLNGYRYDPKQVKISQSGGDLKVHISGPWRSAIFWEVPLLALISELYFYTMNLKPDDECYIRAEEKAKKLFKNQIKFSEFGTRRRFSLNVQDNVVSILKKHCPEYFLGTSNPHLAQKYDLLPLGTIAHEFHMGCAALFGYKMANQFALEIWTNEYSGDLGIALSDTYKTSNFLNVFTRKHAKLWDGCRQDSGSTFDFAEKLIAHYESLKIDPKSKTILFSDSLNVDKCIELQNAFGNRINCRFGIGTFLTSDCGHKPLNIVIKMTKCNGKNTVKLSDDAGKHTGDPDEIRQCKEILQIQ